MNKIYRIIWSKAKNCYVVVSEIAKRSGKSSSGFAKKMLVTSILAGALVGNGMGTVHAAFEHGNEGDLHGYDQIRATADDVTLLNTLLGEYTGGEDGKAGFAKIDASNVGDYIVQWGQAIGTGAIAADDEKLVSGKTVYAALKNLQAGEGVHDYHVNSTTPESDTNYNNTGAIGDNALAAGVSAKAEGIDSTAVGYNAHAIGGTALAVGTSVTATGNQSVAIGTSANAEKDSSIAIGTGVSAKGPNSIAIGTGVTAEGQGAIALGSNGALAKGNGSMAFGSGTTAGIREVNEETGAVTKTTYNDTAFGNGTTAIGGNSTAFGTGSKATGANSTAFGGGSTVASGTGATAFGLGTTAAGDYSTAFGRGGARALGPGATAFGEGTYSNGLLTGSFRVYSNAATAPHTYLHGAKGFQAYVNVNGRQIAVDGTKTALYMGRGTAAAIDWGSGMLFPVYLSKQGSPVVKIGGVLYFVDNARSGVMKQGTKATDHELQTYEGYDFVSSSTKPNSTAFGLGTMAIGASSTAFGDKTIAVGANSTAFGTRSQAIGDLATAFGTDTLAYGAESTAWGRDTAAIGPMATAFGNDTRAVKSSSLAFGNNTKAVGEHSTAWGYMTVAGDAAGTTAWGKMTEANGPYATAWGMDGTKAEKPGSTAWGSGTYANGSYATAWGVKTKAIASFSDQTAMTAFGTETTAAYDNATAFGYKTLADQWNATAWGEQTEARYTNATTWGKKTLANQFVTTAWGEDTQAVYSHATAWGKSTKANGYVATVWGERTRANESHATAWGRDTIAKAFAATSWGEMTQANSSHATSFGRDTIANKSFDTAWGDETTADGPFATAFGKGTVAKGSTATSWGEFTLAGKAIYDGKEVLVHQPGGGSWGGNASRTGETITNKFIIQDPITKEALKEVEVKNGDLTSALREAGVTFSDSFAGTAFGQLTNASGSMSTAFGQQTTASGDMSTAFGKDSKATKFAATAFGKATEASGDMSTAFGENTKAKAFATTAFGQNSVARGATSTAFGTNSEADGANSLAALGGKTGGTWGDPEQEGDSSQFGTWGGTASVAVGQGAVAMQDYTYAIGRSAEVTNTNAIAIGNDSKVWKDKGMAFGTDAKVAAANSIAIGNTVYVGKDGDDAAEISNGIVIGNESNVFGEKSIAIGYGNTVRGKSSSVIGDPNEISGDNNIIHANNVNDGGVSNLVVVGHHDEGNTHTYLENSVALGANSYMTEIGGMPSIKINGTQYNFAGGNPVGTVSVGSAGKERTITNVAAGRISETSTDAINGSQLYYAIRALNEKVVVEAGDSSVNVDSKVEPEDAAGAGTTGAGTTSDGGNNAGTTGGNTTGGNNAGTTGGNTTAGGNDAGTTAGGNTGAAAGGDSAVIEPTRTTTYIVTANTTTAEAGSDNLTVEDSNPGGDDKTHHYTIDLAKDITVDTVTVNKQINVGGDTTITGDTITTKTVNADTFNAGDTTINNDGLTIKNGPSVTKNGIDAGGKKITNVAPGTDGTDAVNVNQLREANQDIYNSMNRLDNSTRKGIAGAAALAALHPLDFDPDDKWEFSAGVGNYRGETAAAIGAFYHPNDDTIFSLGATVGNGENLVNGGVTFRFGQNNHQSRSKKAMAKEIVELRAEVAELKAMVYSMANGRMPGLDLTKSEEFPDTPENHWAYDYVSVLAGNGVLEGYQDGFFKGDRTLTRYEMAAIIYRAMMKGVDVDERMKEEFAPELARVKVDTLTNHSDGTPSIQRVRVIKGRE